MNGFFRSHPNKGHAAPADYSVTECTGCMKLQNRITEVPANKVPVAAALKRRRKRIGKAHCTGSWQPSCVKWRIIAFKRRSPDRCAAYYHDAVRHICQSAVRLLSITTARNWPNGYSLIIRWKQFHQFSMQNRQALKKFNANFLHKVFIGEYPKVCVNLQTDVR